MKPDIQTLALVSCLTFLTQFIALVVQYFVNRSYRGVSWWLLGSFLWALGVILMPTVNIKSLEVLARVANPLTILGFIFLYIGILRFLEKKENQRVLVSVFTLFSLFYYYFMFVRNDISSRTVAMSSTFLVFSFLTARGLFFYQDKPISVSANFTGIVFTAFGCFSVVRIGLVLFSPPIVNYSDQGEMLALSFIVPIIASLLWTFGFIIMVNQRLHAENLSEKEKLELIFNTSPDAALISRLSDGAIIDVNAGFLLMSGYPRSELLQNTTIRINIWHDPTDRDDFIKKVVENGSCENQEYVFQRKDGSLLIGSISANIIPIRGISHIISVVHDITQNKKIEETVRESEELYRSILNASPDDITITDLQGHILVISPAAKKMFGYELDYEQFIGTPLVDYIVPEDRERARSNIIKMMRSDYNGPNEYHGIRKDQSIFDIEVNSGMIHGANGQPAKMVFMVRNISERKQSEMKIQQLIKQLEIEKKAAELNAITDSLTGLANRRYFDEALRTEFQRLKRTGTSLSLIMLDVDHFKNFNDTYGHLAGDECLGQIGSLLKTFMRRGTDIVARYGGEEFVAILPETDVDGAFSLAEQIRKAVAGLAIPHADSDNANVVTVSLGVVTAFPNTGASGAEQVVLLADEAMYRAKKGGRNQTSVTVDRTVLDSQPTG